MQVWATIQGDSTSLQAGPGPLLSPSISPSQLCSVLTCALFQKDSGDWSE